MTSQSKRIIFRSRIKGPENKDNEFDFYETPTWGTELLLTVINLPTSANILEPCNGRGSISNVLRSHGHNVTTFDIDKKMEADKYIDFLEYYGEEGDELFDAVITNPPFKTNNNWEFAKKALELVKVGGLVIMLGILSKVEGQKRRKFYDEYPLYQVLVHSKRFNINGKVGIGYAWFVWKKGYIGETTLKLI